MKIVVPSKSVPNQKWRCDPNRSDQSHLLIIKEEKNQVVIIKISQGTNSKNVALQNVALQNVAFQNVTLQKGYVNLRAGNFFCRKVPYFH